MEKDKYVYDIVYDYSNGQYEKIGSFSRPEVAREFVEKYVPKYSQFRYQIKPRKIDNVYDSVAGYTKDVPVKEPKNINLRRLLGIKKMKKISIENHISLPFKIKVVHENSDKSSDVKYKSIFTLKELKTLYSNIQRSINCYGARKAYTVSFGNGEWEAQNVTGEQFLIIKNTALEKEKNLQKVKNEINDIQIYLKKLSQADSSSEDELE